MNETTEQAIAKTAFQLGRRDGQVEALRNAIQIALANLNSPAAPRERIELAKRSLTTMLERSQKWLKETVDDTAADVNPAP